MMDFINKHSSILLTWFGSLCSITIWIYWRLKQSEKDYLSLKIDVEMLKSDSARKNDVDIKLEKLEEHLHEHIKQLETDIKIQNDQNRNFVDRVFQEFTAVRSEISKGFADLNNTIHNILKRG